jgi:DNA-binding NarL/FixJ family response regulator
MSIRLAIVDDSEFALKVILEKLLFETDLSLKVTAQHGQDLLDKLAEDPNVDIVLMDIQMPQLGGIAATRLIRQRYPQIKVIMLTTFDDDETIFEAICAGATGYLLKEEPTDAILCALADAMDGGAAMSPGIALKALNLIRSPLGRVTTPEDFGLTKREVELLEQLKDGLSYDQIGDNLFISTGTVRKHIESIYRKLHVSNKVKAVCRATENRII